MNLQEELKSYDNADVDSDIEELLDYIVAKLDEGAEIVSSMEL